MKAENGMKHEKKVTKHSKKKARKHAKKEAKKEAAPAKEGAAKEGTAPAK